MEDNKTSDCPQPFSLLGQLFLEIAEIRQLVEVRHQHDFDAPVLGLALSFGVSERIALERIALETHKGASKPHRINEYISTDS
jgi:hypothetical protein